MSHARQNWALLTFSASVYSCMVNYKWMIMAQVYSPWQQQEERILYQSTPTVIIWAHLSTFLSCAIPCAWVMRTYRQYYPFLSSWATQHASTQVKVHTHTHPRTKHSLYIMQWYDLHHPCDHWIKLIVSSGVITIWEIISSHPFKSLHWDLTSGWYNFSYK